MTFRDTILLFLLAALWGASFLFIRIAVPVLRPFPLVFGRVLLGGLILLGYAFIIGQSPDWRTNWKRYLIIGLINNAIPFTMISAAQLHLTASLAALLNATTPLFSAVIAAIWIKDRLTLPKLTGLLLGIIGVGIIVGWQNTSLETTRFVSVLLMLGASLSYGVAVVYGKVAFKGVQPVNVAIGQLFAASLWIFPFVVRQPPVMTVQPNVLLSLIGLAVLSTSLAYLIYFHLIESAGPTPAASVTLLVPFFSSLWGAVFLGERLQPNEIAWFMVILVSLLLVTGLWQNVPMLRRAR